MALKQPRSVVNRIPKRVQKASRKQLISHAKIKKKDDKNSEHVIGQHILEISDPKASEDEEAEPVRQPNKVIDGVEYMEMIDWDEYKTVYFGKIHKKQRDFLFNLITKEL